MDTLNELYQEIHDRVEAAIVARTSTDIAGVKLTITAVDDDQVTVRVDGESFGRFFVSETGLKQRVEYAVANAIKTQFREAGPEAALAAVREE